MRILALAGCLMVSGCMAFSSVEGTVPLESRPPQDISAWMDSSEAHRGYIFLCEELERGAATDVAAKIVALDQEAGVERITLVLNSFGGEVSAWRMIHNAMRLTAKPVDTVNIGNCYSAACAIFASATGRRYTYENAHFMVHKPEMLYPSGGRYKEIVDFETQAYEGTLRNKADLPSEWFPLTGKERYFNSHQALQYRFVDKVIDRLPVTTD